MSSRLTVDQLEQMKTHELADLLANIVLVLRRMPDVSCVQLQPVVAEQTIQQTTPEATEPIKKRTTGKKSPTTSVKEEAPLADVTSLVYTEEELKRKKVAELQKIVVALHIPTSSKKKDDLVSKILARQGHEHSEQFAIQNL